MLIDLHAHTNASGGKSLDELARETAARGLDALVVADHERSADTAQAIRDGEFAIPVFAGVEIASRSGDLIVIPGEIDPVLTREEWRELNALERPELQDVVAWAEANDAVVLLAHPYDRERRGAPRDRLFTFKGIAGVEIGTDESDATSNRVALEAVGRSALPAFGGSAHQRGRGDGEWMTLLASPVSTQQELVEALRSGDFWAVQTGRQPARNSGGRRERDGGRERDGDRPREGRRHEGRSEGRRR